MGEYYHGSNNKINKFTDSFVGGEEANDQAGPGIYFTKDLKQAKAYGDHIHTVELNPKGVIYDREGTSASREELITLMKQSENWEDTAYNFSEDPERGVEEAADLILQYNYSQLDQFNQVWYDWYRYDPVAYVRNLVGLGYDMADVNFDTGDGTIENAVVYNPSIIKTTDHYEKPTESIRKIVRETIESLMGDNGDYKTGRDAGYDVITNPKEL